MKENNYYEISDQNFRQYPVKFISRDKYFNKLLFLNENEEKQINDNVVLNEIILTNLHLQRIGFIDKNDKYLSKNGYYIFPLYAIGGTSNQNLSLSFFGYIIKDEEKALEFFAEFNDYARDYFQGKITEKEMKGKFHSFSTVNQLIEELKKINIIFDDTDFILTGIQK